MSDASVLSLANAPMNKESFYPDDRIWKLKPWLIELLVSVLAFLFIFISYIVIKPLNQINNTQNGAFAKGYVFFLMALEGVATLYLLAKKKLTFRRSIYLLILFGFLLRLMYMLYTPATTRQYDTWSSNDDAHYDYALSFYQTGALPTTHITEDTIYQFYHPPFNAFIQGMFMHVFEACCWNSTLKESAASIYSGCQILACFYMFLTALFFTKAICRSSLNNHGKLLAIAFVNLYPRLIQFSGQLNNDALSVLFSAIAIYYFCRWYFEKKSWLYNMLTALFVGLALFAKMSAASFCLGLAVGYVIELVRSIRKKDGSLPLWQLVLQYCAFLAIAAVLGLWWQAYTHFVYGLPFNFVFKNLNTRLFTGTQSWVENNRYSQIASYDSTNISNGNLYTNGFVNFLVRFVLPVYFPDFSYGVFCSAANNYNILCYALRSSIFGEFTYWYGLAQGISVSCVLFLYVVWFSNIVGIVYNGIKEKKLEKDTQFAIYLTLGMIIMYLYLQISMPYGCSMDFRYIVPIILPVGYLLGKNIHQLENQKTPFAHGLYYTISFSSILFLTSTSLFYMAAI